MYFIKKFIIRLCDLVLQSTYFYEHNFLIDVNYVQLDEDVTLLLQRFGDIPDDLIKGITHSFSCMLNIVASINYNES